MDRLTEFGTNIESVRALLGSVGAGCLLLSDHANVAWLTGGGRSYVSLAVEQGVARVLITPTAVFLLTSNNEAERLEAEEFLDFPWQVIACPWWEGLSSTIKRLAADNSPLAVDSHTPWTPNALVAGAELARLRISLSDNARDRARSIGKIVGNSLATVCKGLQRGESEHEIAGRLVGALVQQGLDVPTCLIAVDDRAFRWRHFLPTDQRLDHYAILSVCARKGGLVISCTRLVHFGPLPEELRLRVEAVCRVDAALIAATKPGAISGDLIEVARRAYADEGFPSEWRNHHQGGLAGYRGREWFAVPDGRDMVAEGQLVAWNPTLPGAKAEDTLLVGADGNEIITESEEFPYLEIRTGTGVIRRPGVLIR